MEKFQQCRVNAAKASIVSAYLRAAMRVAAATSEQAINAQFVMEQPERFSFSIRKLRVVVLDNARIHRGRQILERIEAWQQRVLFIF